MNTRSTSKLGDANDRVFNITWCDHHEVGQLINNDKKIRVRRNHSLTTGKWLHLAGTNCLVEVIDVAVTEVCEIVVTHIHFTNNPLQSFRSLLRVRDDRRDQMWNPFVRSQFDAFGIDQNHAHFVRR